MRRPHLFAATLRFGTTADAKAFGQFTEKGHGIDVADPPFLPSHRVLSWETDGSGHITMTIEYTSVRGDRRYVGEFLSVAFADWCINRDVPQSEVGAEMIGIVRVKESDAA